MAIYVRARFGVRDGQVSEFGQVVRAMTQAASEESGTQSFLWFSAPDPGGYVALERYTDSAAFRRHSEHVGALLNRLMGLAELTLLEIYGDVDEELRAWADQQPQAVVYPSALFGA